MAFQLNLDEISFYLRESGVEMSKIFCTHYVMFLIDGGTQRVTEIRKIKISKRKGFSLTQTKNDIWETYEQI